MSPALEHFVQLYVRDRLALRELDPRTAAGTRRILLGFVGSLPPIQPSELAYAHVEAYMKGLTVSAATARQRFSKVRSFCRWLITHGHLEIDPTARMKPPKQPRPVPRAHPLRVIQRLMEVCPDRRARLIVLLEVQEGLRACEVSRLELGDIDFGEQTVLIRGKGAKERLLPMSVETWEAFEEYLLVRGPSSGPLICSHTEPHKGLSPEYLSGLVGQWLRLAGMPKGSGHGLRHAMATGMLRDGGADIRDVQLALGHTHLTSTQIYLPFSDARRLRKVMGGRRYGSAADVA